MQEYWQHWNYTDTSFTPAVVRMRSSINFLHQAFSGQSMQSFMKLEKLQTYLAVIENDQSI